jgi:hypothetical protein
MRDDSCPICHGTGQVHYDLTGCRIPNPLPCRACKGTGRRLWKEADPVHVEVCRQAAKDACAKRGPRTGPYAKTLIALACSRYTDYCARCAASGMRPSTKEAWYRIRTEHRNHPDRVEGRTGPR